MPVPLEAELGIGGKFITEARLGEGGSTIFFDLSQVFVKEDKQLAEEGLGRSLLDLDNVFDQGLSGLSLCNLHLLFLRVRHVTRRSLTWNDRSRIGLNARRTSPERRHVLFNKKGLSCYEKENAQRT